MKQTKYKRILLIDDDKIVNHVQERIIKSFDIANEIIVKDSATSALAYLSTILADDSDELPEIIFLDLNMPVMSGFDFLDAFCLLIKEGNYKWNKEACRILILSSSSSEDDIERAFADPYVYGYITKPLTQASLEPYIQ